MKYTSHKPITHYSDKKIIINTDLCFWKNALRTIFFFKKKIKVKSSFMKYNGSPTVQNQLYVAQPLYIMLTDMKVFQPDCKGVSPFMMKDLKSQLLFIVTQLL